MSTRTTVSLSRAWGGLVLVTGQTGSGKSTSLAALVNYINENFHRHIISIEDPIEFIFRDRKSLVDQREVQRRLAERPPPKTHHTRGYGWLFAQHILGADHGCDFDFLRAEGVAEAAVTR